MNLRNKRFISIILSFVLILGIMIVPSSVFAEEVKTLTIVHVNDVHGRLKLNERDKELGYGRLKAKVDELKAENPNLLLVNAGDVFHGDANVNLTGGKVMVEMMNKVGFDIMIPGNHDFNYGYNRLLELKEIADFPILGANIIKEADGKSDFEPYIIKELENGLKIGIFGITTEETKVKSHPSNTEGIEFKNPVEVSKEMVKKLKAEKVDIIIAVTHLGIEGTVDTTSKEIGEKVEGIDLIIDGHSHEELNQEVGSALLVQAGSYTKNIGLVNIEFKDNKIVKKEAKLITFDEAKDIVPDAEIEEEIGKIEELNAPKKAEVIGKTKVSLDGERANVRTGETNLGNLITDAMRKSTGADIAFTNGGGIRASISEGDVTFGHIVTSFPFTNTLAVIEITGAELKEALEHGVDLYPEQAGHFPHVSGMTYKFDAGKPVGERILEVNVNGEPLVADTIYKLVTNDFVAAGGDGYTMFKGKNFIAEGGLLSDVLIDYFEEVKEVEPVLEGRIVAIPAKVEEPAPVPTPVIEPTPAPVAKKYVVKAGDVLWKIAKSFNTTWEKLAEFNKLKNPHLIFPGQEILIP